MAAIRLEGEDAFAEISCLDDGRYHIRSAPKRGGVFSAARPECVTDYPLDLIEKIFSLKGPQWLCDDISREQDNSYVKYQVSRGVLSYATPESFRGARILDFGSGTGSSSIVIARMFPETEIIGVDLDVRSQEIAEAKAQFHGLGNIRFLTSPRPDTLPDVGKVDHVFLTAVYEHLLPGERRSVLPMLWDALKPGGTMFIYGTPYRWWPVEVHTTRGLPLLNYLPDGLAHVYTRHCARDNIRRDDWPTLLRKGIRGGSITEVKRMLRGRRFRLLQPAAIGGRDGVDLWWHYTPKRLANRVFYRFMKLVRYLTGLQTVKTLEIALRKE